MRLNKKMKAIQSSQNYVRNSNMELLRIIAMVLVILYHISYHGTRYQLLNESSIEKFGNGCFCDPSFYPVLFWVEGAMPLGQIANSIFILISGYFLISKTTIDLTKIASKLILQLGFAITTLTVGSTIFYRIYLNNTDSLISLRSIADFNNINWYVGYYFSIIVIASLLLNKHLQSLDEYKYRGLLLTTFAIFSFCWPGDILDGLTSGLRTLLCGIFLYSCGGYIKRFNPFKKIKVWGMLIVIVLIYALFYLSWYNSVVNACSQFFIDNVNNATVLFFQPIFGLDVFSFMPIIIAILIFELFRRLQIPNSRLINLLGKSTFMTYLIHENDFWRNMWRSFDWVSMLSVNPSLYCLNVMKWCGITFLIGLLAYMVYCGIATITKRILF